MKKAAFLDRDGVINEDVVHLDSAARLRLLPGVAAAIRALNESGYLVIVVSNQGGIAKGFIAQEGLDEIHAEISARLAKEGAHIDKIYYCPHHPEGVIAEYTAVCDCRKPGTGMIEKAMTEFDIDLAGSFLVGDKPTDILAGKKMGLKTVLIGAPGDAAPDFSAADLEQAIAYFLP